MKVPEWESACGFAFGIYELCHISELSKSFEVSLSTTIDSLKLIQN
jgi:hypothetical protein